MWPTECFLTIKKTPETPFGCPFCLVPNLEVRFTGPKTKEAIQIELEDQRKVDALKLEIRQEEIEADRQRELRRKQEREASRPLPVPALSPSSVSPQSSSPALYSPSPSSLATSPPSASPLPSTPPNTAASMMGSPTLPSQLAQLRINAKSIDEIDEAELQAAIWLSLNPEAAQDAATPSSPTPDSPQLTSPPID